jgi:hypothetical protein
MRDHSNYIPFSTRSGFGSLILIALCAIAPELWTSEAWAQQRRPRYVAPVALGHSAPANAWAQSSSPKTTPIVQSATNPNSALGSALASCGKESDRSEPFSLPGGKGDVKLDRCYQGRGQNICSNNALVKEGRSLLQDYGKIIEAKYPELSNVSGVCAINPDALSAHVQNAAEFTNRYKALSAEYTTRSNCGARISQSLRDVVLPDMAQAPEMIKSMIESIEGDSKDLAVVQAQVVEVAGKIDASQKAMVTIGKIHQTMCFKDQRPDTVSDAKR